MLTAELLLLTATVARDAPIIPISAQLKYNIDAVNEYICTKIPVPKHDFEADPRLIVIRSFDVNKPGSTVDELKGGVAGGSILSGVFKVGQEVEIRPGKVFTDQTGKFICQPLRTRVVSLFAEGNDLQFAVPGGLIGVGTLVDPILCKGDKLLGNVMTAVGKGADIYVELEISCECAFGSDAGIDIDILNPPTSLLAATTFGSEDYGQEASQVKKKTVTRATRCLEDILILASLIGTKTDCWRAAFRQRRCFSSRRSCFGSQGRSCKDRLDRTRVCASQGQGGFVAQNRQALAFGW